MKGRTRDGSGFQGKKNIYFCSHPDDRDYYLKEFSEDIFYFTNCVIWHDDGEVLTDEERAFHYSRMDMAIVPITERFVTEDNFAKCNEIGFFKSNHIPILPVITDDRLFKAANGLFDNLQVIEHKVTDKTKLGYYNKLERYLKDILLKEGYKATYGSIFKDSVFISYRKKNRATALRLMEKLHSDPSLYSLGLWYDEFLTPGEDFNDEIESAIENSCCVIMLITPDTLETGNYIITDEYPCAKQHSKPVLGVLSDGVTLSEAKAIFKDIDFFVDLESETFAENCRKALKFRTLDLDDPKQCYMLGLSYLSGVNVEKNTTLALRLLTDAAENGFADAAFLLADIYRDGIGTGKDSEKEQHWAEVYAANRLKKYSDTHDTEALSNAADAMLFFCNVLEKYDRTNDCDDMYAVTFRMLSEHTPHDDTLPLKASVSTAYGTAMLRRGMYAEAEKLFRTALNCYDRMMDNGSDEISESDYLIAELQYNLGTALSQLNDFDSAKKHLNSAQKQLSVFAEQDPETYNDILIKCLGNLAYVHKAIAFDTNSQKDFAKAEELMLSSVQLADDMLLTKRNTYEIILARSCSMLATFYMQVGRTDNSVSYYERAIDAYISVLKYTSTDCYTELASTFMNSALLSRSKGDYGIALRYAESAAKIFKDYWCKAPLVYDLQYAKALMGLGKIHELNSEYERSEQFYNAALSIYERSRKQTSSRIYDTGECRFEYGNLLLRQNRLNEAKDQFTAALQLFSMLSDLRPGYCDIVVSEIHKQLKSINEKMQSQTPI